MFLQLIITLSVASNYLVKAPQANPHEFFVYAQNSNTEKISKFFLKCESADKLQQLAQKAQFNFLNGSMANAENSFQEITDLKWNCDWNEDQRELIVIAMLRMAQFSKNDDLQNQWLLEAINFDEVVQPDLNLFPPPLVNKYKSIDSTHPKQKIMIPESFKKYNHLLRNGKTILFTTFDVAIPSGRARYTFVSDTYQIERSVLNLAELQEIQLEAKPLVSGDCTSFEVSPLIKDLTQVKLFFSLDCQKTINETLSTQTPIPNSAIIPTITTQNKKNWVERNLFLIGATVLGTALIVNEISKHNSDKSSGGPTTTIQRN